MNSIDKKNKTVKYIRYTLTISILIVFGLFFILLLFSGKGQSSKVILKKAHEKEIEVSIEVEKAEKKIVKPVSPSKEKVAEKKEKNIKVSDMKGALPPISANYRKYLGFRKYAELVEERGGCFIIMGGSSKNIYRINFNFRSLQKVDIGTLKKAGYSSRSRIISDEPALDYYRNIAKEKYNLANPEVILLVPNKYENYIASVIVNSGISKNNISSFKGYYKVTGSEFILLLNKVTYISGRSESIDLRIKL